MNTGCSPEGEDCIRTSNAAQRCAAPANALSRSTDAKAGAFSRTTRSREGPSRGHPPRRAQDAGSWHADPPRCRAEGPSTLDKEYPDSVIPEHAHRISALIHAAALGSPDSH